MPSQKSPFAPISPGSSEHYSDAAYYTKTYAGRLEDVAYYVDLAVQLGGEVLEYGTGNGRIALPIARHGIPVTGIDASRPMLDDFRERLAKEPAEVQKRITLREGDMRTTKLRKKFPVVLCTFNTILHLYTHEDLAAFFARVQAHLAPGGRFVVDLSTPSLADLAHDPDPTRERKMPRFRHPRLGLVRYGERFAYDFMTQIFRVTMRTTPENGAPEEIVELTQRQFFPQEFRHYLQTAGFEIVHTDGSFTSAPPDDFSEVLIFHARSSRGAKTKK